MTEQQPENGEKAPVWKEIAVDEFVEFLKDLNSRRHGMDGSPYYPYSVVRLTISPATDAAPEFFSSRHGELFAELKEGETMTITGTGYRFDEATGCVILGRRWSSSDRFGERLEWENAIPTALIAKVEAQDEPQPKAPKRTSW